VIATPRLASIGLMIAAIGIVGLPVTPAVAGVYEVRVGCDTVRNAWWPGAMAGMTAYNTCAGATPSGMVARVALTSNPNDKVPYGSRAEWRFVAPAGTAIVGGSLTGDMHTAGGGWQTGLWSDAVGGLVVCSSDCNSTFGFNTGPVGEVHFSSACYRDTGCYRVDREKGGLAAYVALTDATLRLADYYPPAISSDAADGLGARWLNDRTPLGYSAADAGSGVAAVQFWPFYGSGQPDTKFAGCDPTRPSPCPATLSDASTGPLTLDPRGLGDGIYTGVLRAIDYSGENSDHAFTYRVDRTRPDAPTAQGLLGATDWRRTNAFDLSWQNPKESCAQGDAPECAPISSVRYQLCPAGTSDSGRCTTGEVKGNRLERVTDLPVPRVGVWTAKVAAVDAAGNVGEFSDSITLRFDDQPPTAAGFEPQDPSDPRELADRKSVV